MQTDPSKGPLDIIGAHAPTQPTALQPPLNSRNRLAL